MPRLVTLGRIALGSARSAQAKPALLLAYVSIEGPQSRRRLAELFWPHGQGGKSLSMALVRLRAMAPGCLDLDGRLVASRAACDAVELEEALAAGDLDTARGLYAGPFFVGVDVSGVASELEEWLLSTRERLAGALQAALLEEAERCAAAGETARAGTLAAEAWRVPGAPPPEAPVLDRLGAVLRSAWHPLAHEVRRALEEMGASPPAPSRKRSGAYLGRDREHALLRSLMERDDVRLVTVLGPGGVGKTRLAEEVLAELRSQGVFPDGTHMVRLETVADPDELPLAVARAIGAGAPREDAWAQVRAALARRRSLVVLDNMEQLAAAAPRLAALVEAVEHAKLLVTSRVRLGLAAEHVVRLGGLAVPEEDEPWASASRSPAVQLLLACAGAAGAPRLVDDRRALVRVCRAVGGLPLAIEMAASALRAVPPADLAARLEEEPYRLGSASVDAPERHRSLARVVAASWRALPPRARTAAARLGVFRGGFTLRAAADVAGVGRRDLSDLIDHGWLVLSPAGRYSFHPHLAAAAARRLERRPEALRALRERHARWYLDLVRQAAPAAASRGGHEAVGLGPPEHANLRAALAWFAEEDQASGLEMAALLAGYWTVRGMFVEGTSHLERFLSTGAGDDAALAKAWVALGSLRLRRQPSRSAREALERGRELAESVGDDRSLSWAESGLAVVAVRHDGDVERARHHLEASLEAAVRSGDEGHVSDALRHIGHFATEAGDYARSRAALDDALDLAERIGDEERAGKAALELGTVLEYLGERERAHEVSLRALRAFETLDDPYGTAMALVNLAIGADDLDTRGRHFRRALEVFRTIGYEDGVGLVLNDLAGDAQKAGRPEEARVLLDESLVHLRRVGDRSLLGHALFIYAKVHLDLGEREAAKRRIDECLEVAAEGADGWARMRALEVLGRWHAEGGDAELARRSLLQARELAERAGDKHVLAGVEKALAELGGERLPAALDPGSGLVRQGDEGEAA